MRMHKITFPGRVDLTRFAHSQTAASATRRELAERFGVGVRSGTIEPIEVDTKKEALIAFLNEELEEATSDIKETT